MAAQPRLLIVEDNTNLLGLIEEALAYRGFDVITACDGPGAIARLEEDGRIDYVFSDVSMPNGMSGIELARHAARLKPGIRVVLTSGYTRSQLPELPDNVAFLPKPYRLDQLMEALDPERNHEAIGGDLPA